MKHATGARRRVKSRLASVSAADAVTVANLDWLLRAHCLANLIARLGGVLVEEVARLAHRPSGILEVCLCLHSRCRIYAGCAHLGTGLLPLDFRVGCHEGTTTTLGLQVWLRTATVASYSLVEHARLSI